MRKDNGYSELLFCLVSMKCKCFPILHKQLNKIDWSKIQLVVWQSNHRHLKFCLPSFLFQLLVECLFVMDNLLFSFCLSLLRVTWWLLPPQQVWQFMAVVDAVIQLFWAVSWWQCCLKGGDATDCLASQSFGPHQVVEVRPVWCITLDRCCCCCCFFQKHDNRNLR